MRILFEVAGDKQISREILRVGERAGNVTLAWPAVASLFREETQLQFDTEGQYASGGWKPLKPETLRRKRAKGQDERILRASGDLFASLTQRNDLNQIVEMRPTEFVFGSRLPYAGVHQNPKPSNPLPRRRPLEFTEPARRQTVKIVQRYIVTGEVTR